MADPAVVFSGAAKIFGLRGQTGRRRNKVSALDDVTFEIGPGEHVGIIGPNGAGKTTAIRLMLGLIIPTHGSVALLGDTRQPRSAATRRRIGVVLGGREPANSGMRVRDVLMLHDLAYGRQHAYQSTAARLTTSHLDVERLLDRRVRQLSLGERARLNVALAIAHDPDVLIMDEPSLGLDILARRSFRKDLTALAASRGTTLVLTSHDAVDIEQLCERAIVLSSGKVIFDGRIGALRADFAQPPILKLVADDARSAAAVLAQQYVVKLVDEHRLEVRDDLDTVSLWEAASIASEVTTILGVELSTETLEDAIGHLYEQTDTRDV